MTIDKLLKDGRYLPKWMRDFHNQKDLFREVGLLIENAKKKPREETGDGYLLKDLPNWVNAHIYTVDFFLWAMARKGYVLRKIKVEVNEIPKS